MRVGAARKAAQIAYPQGECFYYFNISWDLRGGSLQHMLRKPKPKSQKPLTVSTARNVSFRVSTVCSEGDASSLGAHGNTLESTPYMITMSVSSFMKLDCLVPPYIPRTVGV